MAAKNKKNKIGVLMLAMSFLTSACFLASGIFSVALGSEDEMTEEEKKESEEREKEAEETEEEKKEIEEKLKDTQKEKEKNIQEKIIISDDINQINSNINLIQSAINKTEENVNQLQAEINEKQDQIEFNGERISDLLRDINQADMEIRMAMLASNTLDQYFSNIDLLQQIQDKLFELMKWQKEEKADLEEKKQGLEEVVEEHDSHKAILAQEKNKKNSLLGQVEEEIQEKEATIDELQKKLVELQNDLNILTGKSYNAKDIREAVEFASKETGVPRGVLYGFLKMETNLGANTGQCTYKEVEKVALTRYKKLLKENKKWQSSIDLLKKRKEIFYDIVDELGYSKNKKVSCTPTSYIGQGGAMGVSQFMSDVWLGYEPNVRSITGRSKPDPWNLTDGVTAMALKLKKAGATSDSKSAIKQASINYLGSFNTRYYEGILYWSKNYKKLFN